MKKRQLPKLRGDAIRLTSRKALGMKQKLLKPTGSRLTSEGIDPDNEFSSSSRYTSVVRDFCQELLVFQEVLKDGELYRYLFYRLLSGS